MIQNKNTDFTWRTILVQSSWIVGYHPEHDEIFMYCIDQDDICRVFRNGGLDSMGFFEFMNFNKAEILGEL
jgi:hypothetical protein